MRKYSNIPTVILLFIIATSFTGVVVSLNNGLGITPPMGWNSWNHFQCNINEDLIKRICDALINFKLADAGYRYIVVDDCWAGGRHADGHIFEDQNTFPFGIKLLSDYVRLRGLKVGIVSDAGNQTCNNRVGSFGYEELDALDFAYWGVAYLKYTNCGSSDKQQYLMMRNALNKTNSQIFFSICDWGSSQSYLWGPDVGNSWRTAPDIQANWGSIMFILDQQKNITQSAGPGGWNDPDVLQVGNGDLTIDEQKSHFSLWAALKAPLMLGFDIRSPPEDTLKIVLNSEIIAINQDPLGIPVNVAESTNDFDIWCGPLTDGHVALLLNKAEDFQEIHLDFSKHCELEGIIFVRNVWLGEDMGTFLNNITSKVPKHGIIVFKLTESDGPEPTGASY